MENSIRLLLVEDSDDDAFLVAQELIRGGFEVSSERVDTAIALTNILKREPWDIIVCDYSMPSFTGTEALEIFKKSGQEAPFIFVTDTMCEDEAVAAMRAGAKDYIVKGSLKLLVPAVERELREAQSRRDQARVHDKLLYLAFYDSVTGLPNHACFRDQLEQAIRSAEPQGLQVAVLVMKINNFGEINETFGNQLADQLLAQVAQRLRGAMGELDTLASLRGNEFGVLQPHVADVKQSIQMLRKITVALEQPFALHEFSIDIRPRFGVAIFPDHGNDADSLIQRARIASTASRRSGNLYTIYSLAQDQNLSGDLTLFGDLRRAIAERQLYLLYQPKVDLRTGGVVGVEALARWKHPELGPIPPDRFVRLAERTGLIIPLTAWALDESLRQCRAWNHEKLRISMAVNFSMQYANAAEVWEQLIQTLAGTEIPRDQLQLEITESTVMIDPTLTMKNIKRIRKMGVRFSIDDFGTGHSSLAYLKKLPVDEIKIDKSFISHMTSSLQDSAIVNLIIETGHELGLALVAEGVEDQETMDFLTKLSCDMAQGYHISPPISGPEARSWIKERLKGNAG